LRSVRKIRKANHAPLPGVFSVQFEVFRGYAGDVCGPDGTGNIKAKHEGHEEDEDHEEEIDPVLVYG